MRTWQCLDVIDCAPAMCQHTNMQTQPHTHTLSPHLHTDTCEALNQVLKIFSPKFSKEQEVMSYHYFPQYRILSPGF